MKYPASFLVLAGLLLMSACSDGGGLVNPPETPVATIQVTARAPSIATGDTMRVFAFALSAAGDTLRDKRFRWESSDPAVATVNQAGVVTTKGPGTVMITATAEQKTGSFGLTVLPPPPGPGIGVAPASVSFAATEGQGNPAAQAVSVSNTGGGTLGGLSTTIAYAAGQPTGWLSASLDKPTAPATLTLQASTANRPAGTYNATVTVRSSQSGVAPTTVAVTFTVSPPLPPAPAVPTNLAATSSATQVALSWTDNSSNEGEFRIERKTGSGGTYAQIATVGANANTYTDTNVSGGNTYVYRVRACNAGGCSEFSNEASATIVVPPAAPSNLNASSSGNRINLTWRDNSNNEGEFQIERKIGSAGSWSQIATVGANVTTYTDSSVQRLLLYYYRVRACNSAGCSAYSNEDDDRL